MLVSAALWAVPPSVSADARSGPAQPNASRVAAAAAPSIRSGASDAQGAGPVRLVRPLSSDTIERALAEAESYYAAGQSTQAMQAFATLAELDASSARAWLRLGNLHQRAGNESGALDAYRQAGNVVPIGAADAVARAKALANVALIGLAQVGRTLDELDAMNASQLGDARADLDRQVAEQHERVEASTRRGAIDPRGPGRSTSAGPVPGVPSAVGASVGTTSPRSTAAAGASAAAGTGSSSASMSARPGAAARAAAVPAGKEVITARPVAAAQAAPPAAPFEPYTVDRWIAKVRRAVSAAIPGRSSISEPVTETPLPPRPAVETFLGTSGGARR